MTARFGFTLMRDLDAATLAARGLDPAAHDRWVPATRIHPVRDALRAGDRFTAFTRVGPLRLMDDMCVDEWDRGDDGVVVVRIRKVGRVLGGRIVMVVAPVADGRSVLAWDQTVRVCGVPDALVRLATPLVALGYRVMLARIIDRGADRTGR